MFNVVWQTYTEVESYTRNNIRIILDIFKQNTTGWRRQKYKKKPLKDRRIERKKQNKVEQLMGTLNSKALDWPS